MCARPYTQARARARVCECSCVCANKKTPMHVQVQRHRQLTVQLTHSHVTHSHANVHTDACTWAHMCVCRHRCTHTRARRQTAQFCGRRCAIENNFPTRLRCFDIVVKFQAARPPPGALILQAAQPPCADSQNTRNTVCVHTSARTSHMHMFVRHGAKDPLPGNSQSSRRGR